MAERGSGGGRLLLDTVEELIAELPLAAVCAFIVYDAETFLAATVTRFRRTGPS